MGKNVALDNEKNHVEDHRFTTKQRFEPWIRDSDPHNNGSQSQWRPRPAFSSQ